MQTYKIRLRFDRIAVNKTDCNVFVAHSVGCILSYTYNWPAF